MSRKGCFHLEGKEWFWAVVEAVIWYGFIYYLLAAVRDIGIAAGTALWKDALILLVLGYLGTLTCPWIHRLMKKKCRCPECKGRENGEEGE
ncbi:MAG: hypothetical protein SVV03_04540 [Candidatus Nanohaloarchaea archaeon]|nr:hypothetical protein [Candidatus Nanohaloarchaea archaeon]